MWDDRRYFLAVARTSSIRKAAQSLGVSRSTVLRRVTALEAALGIRLFERLPNGYFTTAAGEELQASAERMETEAIETDRRLAGRDNRPAGSLRVSLPAVFLAAPLINVFAAFDRSQPDIRLELLTSYGMADLKRREADVALRISNDPDENLIGRRIARVARSCYVDEATAEKARTEATPEGLQWIGWSNSSESAQWYRESAFANVPAGPIIDDPNATLEAVRAGMGMAILPCFMGDPAAGVSRMPPGDLLLEQDLWILTHRDLRHTARVAVFTQFMADAFTEFRPLFEGKSV